MKDLLIIVGTMVLGFFLFSMIAGDKDSLKSAGSAVAHTFGHTLSHQGFLKSGHMHNQFRRIDFIDFRKNSSKVCCNF